MMAGLTGAGSCLKRAQFSGCPNKAPLLRDGSSIWRAGKGKSKHTYLGQKQRDISPMRAGSLPPLRLGKRMRMGPRMCSPLGSVQRGSVQKSPASLRISAHEPLENRGMILAW